MRRLSRMLPWGLWALARLTRADYVGGPLTSVYSSADLGGDGLAWTGVADGEGCLHFGANALLTFDGYAWRVDPAGDSYALRGLALAPNGSLLAAATGELGVFTADRSGGWTYRSLIDRLLPADRDVGEMWYAFAQRDGSAVYIGANVVYWWDGHRFELDRFPAERRISACQCGDEIFLHQPGKGVWSIYPGRRQRVISEGALAGGVAVWIERQAAGNLLIASSRGFYLGSEVGCTPVFPAASDFLRRQGLTCVRRLRNGGLAVGTLRGGFAYLNADGSVRGICDRSTGLASDEVFCICPPNPMARSARGLRHRRPCVYVGAGFQRAGTRSLT